MEKRYRGKQIIFAICSKDLKKISKQCDQYNSDAYSHEIYNELLVSGRQPPDCYRNRSRYRGYYCEYIYDGQPYNFQMTSVTVIRDQTRTIIWKSIIFTVYTKLRASITVTLTEMATVTTDDTLETGMVVIFASGLAWFAVSTYGDATALAAIQPPSRAPEDSKTEGRERKPEPECKDCGGADAAKLCASGDKAGYPCELKQNCPNEPMRCSDDKCGGDNGNSQCPGAGEMQGCVCCPDDDPAYLDKTCAGNLEQRCTASRWEQCGCKMIIDGGKPAIDQDIAPTAPVDQASVTSVAKYVFTAIWGADFNILPRYNASATPTPTSCTSGPGSTCTSQPLPVGGQQPTAGVTPHPKPMP
jgi:hypothetical protein